MKIKLILLILYGFRSLGQEHLPHTPLFMTDDTLFMTINTDMRSLLKSRTGEAINHDGLLTLKEDNIEIEMKLRVRGNFRRLTRNCRFPPIYLDFDKDDLDVHDFLGQNKIKLITPCKSDDYVLREFMVYKIFNLLAENSFDVRLVKVNYIDSKGKRKSEEHLSFLLEDEKLMTERLGLIKSDDRVFRQPSISKMDMATVSVFEYFIGNTDWSVPFRHNIKILRTEDSRLVAIPYDFDHAGMVNAPYARPSEALPIASVLNRLYRGTEYSMETYNAVFEKFESIKPDLYALYLENPLFSENYKKFAIKYMDEFYETINNEKKIQREFLFSGDGKSRSAVQIKGLN